MTWVAPPPPPPAAEPLTGPDRPILESFLAWQRRTLLNICAGLPASSLAARPLPTSDLSLLGLVRHLTKVERTWLRQRVAGLDIPALFTARDDDFLLATVADAEATFSAYTSECSLGDAAVAELPFDSTFEHGGDTYSLRLVYVHLISEYARHNGHADMLREAIDGTRGR